MIPIKDVCLAMLLPLLFLFSLLYDHYRYQKYLDKVRNKKKKKKNEIKLYKSNYPFEGGIPVNPMEEELEKKAKESKENAHPEKR